MGSWGAIDIVLTPRDAYQVLRFIKRVAEVVGANASLLFAGKPLVIEALIGTFLTKDEKHIVDLFTQPTVRREHDAVVFLPKDGANHLHASFALICRIIKEDWRVKDHRFYLVIQKSLVRLLNEAKLLHL